MPLHSSSDDEREQHSVTTTTFGASTMMCLSADNLLFVGFSLVQVLAVILIGLVVLWCQQYLGGFQWSVPEQAFNYHPLFMTIGMIILNANGILIYRVTRWWRFRQQKLAHTLVQSSALIVSLAGSYAVYHFHEVRAIPHFYSLHSWLGATAVSGFALSGVAAFVSFLYPGIDPVYRRIVLPFHVFAGTANIVLCAAVAITGITEKAFFSLGDKSDVKYKDLPAAGVLLNMIGITIVVFTILVVWLVTKPEFKRRYIPGVNAPQYKLRREQTTE